MLYVPIVQAYQEKLENTANKLPGLSLIIQYVILFFIIY